MGTIQAQIIESIVSLIRQDVNGGVGDRSPNKFGDGSGIDFRDRPPINSANVLYIP